MSNKLETMSSTGKSCVKKSTEPEHNNN